jgi:hypothetical protein
MYVPNKAVHWVVVPIKYWMNSFQLFFFLLLLMWVFGPASAHCD